MGITLSKAELKRLLNIGGWLTVILLIAIAAARTHFTQASPTEAVVFAAGTSVAISALVIAMLWNLTWTRKWLAWITNRPIVHGVWWGELHSTYQGRQLAPIPIAFVVKQTYVSLSIQSFTPSIGSDSTLEGFDRSEKSKDVRLKYVYEMQREANAEQKITRGYGDLRLQDGGKVLKGFYWTNSPTQGYIKLEFIQRSCNGIDSFDSAKRAAFAAGKGFD